MPPPPFEDIADVRNWDVVDDIAEQYGDPSEQTAKIFYQLHDILVEGGVEHLEAFKKKSKAGGCKKATTIKTALKKVTLACLKLKRQTSTLVEGVMFLLMCLYDDSHLIGKRIRQSVNAAKGLTKKGLETMTQKHFLGGRYVVFTLPLSCVCASCIIQTTHSVFFLFTALLLLQVVGLLHNK